MLDNILLPAIALMGLSLLVGLIHFLSSSKLIGKDKQWRSTIPLEPYEESPKWLRLQKNNLQNLFEYPVIFYFLIGISYLQGISTSLLMYTAWAYFLFRFLHSTFHILMSDGLLRSTPWLLSQIALLILLIEFCLNIL